ncbi:biotin--[acetyl-CoA-carboxylase] ligase [Mycobacterium sp. B14F4]|uniref:biotin--[acetyl-CoA-carboxylase] ligase n=1 Tax=Mycobacterium sp. B14F4 TaxID=3153565 RepID=UPI00325F836E
MLPIVRREPLAAQSLVDGLTPPWRRLEIVDETGSTNADLLARSAAGEDVEGAVLIAEHQTAGRGRSGRTWSAVPFSQIIMSVGVAATDVPVAGWGWLPLAAGVAVVATITDITGVRAELKWPNDVLAGGHKLAGILVEVSPVDSTVIVGIGLNVTLRADELPPGLCATSLFELGAEELDRTALTKRLLMELGARIEAWRAADGADPSLAADYRSLCSTIGLTVRANLPGGRQLVGMAQSIDEMGRLLIEAGGRTVAVAAGDVVHVRPKG